MPIFFVVAFSGSFSSVVELDGYSTDKAVNWMAAWAILQGQHSQDSVGEDLPQQT